MAPAPSGEQLELAFGDQRLVVVEVGGGLRSYSAGGREVLDGYAESELSPSGRGQLLIPWPNRLEDGCYDFDGRTHQLPLNELANRNAIHGLVRWSAWTVAERSPDRVALEHTLHPQPGYPFTLGLRVEYALTERGLSVRTTATNLGDEPCPYGHGAHPYLAVGVPTVDAATLRVPARTLLLSDDRSLPCGRAAVAGTELDFRAPRAIGTTVLDTCFTDLERDGDGRARIELRDPAGAGVALWLDDRHGYVMVFSGDPLPDVARRSLAVEPMTCPPNAFRTGEAVVTLEPGSAFTSEWGIEPRGSSPQGDVGGAGA
ncbi:MAG TPA: aldose 1-epimerase family protein [Gaiellaceae bacterium]